MLNLKKTAVAVLAFSSSAVFAGTMGPVCSAVNVTIPCESTAWMLGGKALYLNSNLGHKTGTVTTSAGSVSSDLNPRYGWGFMIEGAYHFSTGNDLNINWYHMNNGNHRTGDGSTFINGAPTYRTGENFFVAGLTFNPGGYASVNPQWDAVNIELGQHVDFGDMKSVRFHGGFEWARLAGASELDNSGVVATVSNGTLNAPQGFSYNHSHNPTYNGFGPRLGSDFTYDWGNGLGMYANGAMALLAGTNKTSSTYLDVPTGAFVTVSGNTVQVVPELEAKLGLTYGYATAQGDLTLDVGWMWVNYFNVISGVDNSGASLASDVNFGLQGPYIGLKWMGNVA
ncbi:MAG TPA: Lpg1974 family pore-forming outer membrane protein [Legionellaceae bacterium]|nr:Lpg1974 family pore-forming outer membrane protein [Legionellaceae bacterium]